MSKSTLAICVTAVLAIVWYKTASPETKSRLRKSIDEFVLSIPRILTHLLEEGAGKVMATVWLAQMPKRLSS